MTTHDKRIRAFKDIISNTVLSIQKYKSYDIFGANEANVCIIHLEELTKELEKANTNELLNQIQINFSNILKMFGTTNLRDLFYISFPFIQSDKSLKCNAICKFVRPIGYKIVEDKNKEILKELGIYRRGNYDCISTDNSNSFQNKVHGIKIVIKHKNQRILIYGVVDDIIPTMISDDFITKKHILLLEKRNIDYYDDNMIDMFIQSLTIKDYLIHTVDDLFIKYKQIQTRIVDIKKKSIGTTIKDFVKSDLYEQRNFIIHLLIDSYHNDSQYLAYLLYDLLSNEVGDNIDTQEQVMLFDGLPWGIKKLFKDAMKNTMNYTNNLYHFDEKKIPLEQQICLLQASGNIKERAMQKLAEVKAKTDDSGTKARQYLDGLLKIPFNMFREEPILLLSSTIKQLYKKVYNEENNICEIKKQMKTVDITQFYIKRIRILKEALIYHSRSKLISLIKTINDKLKEYNKPKIPYSTQPIDVMKNRLNDFFNAYQSHEIIDEIIQEYNINLFNIKELSNNISCIKQYISDQERLIHTVETKLDNAIYGHKDAKRHIERIIAQWINGENKGYCFGFEGPPGVGKTSFAKKGVANCLTNDDNEPRPFAYIAIGGSSNASTLDGHNYTYVGSTWGRVVDIIIEKKCLNPIIFIDELDKISKTDSGREIIGILTHLTDPSQNSGFQDKYFSGIDIDMSKALFIFSYNDVNAIDKVLLDRIHRIKFESLTFAEKIIIGQEYIMPELCKNMGLTDSIMMTNETLEYIINYYTNESGVRKLKELLFEIVGEVNLRLLKSNVDMDFPLEITIDAIKNEYFKEKHPIDILKINKVPKVGVINGLWASATIGGILQIECLYYPTDTLLDLKLTGLQGDVMKESMHVARTLSWSLLDNKTKSSLKKKFDVSKLKGIHVHCPEGGVQKDGPSAGGAIVVLMYSLLTQKKIRNDVAMTGEITMQGKVTKIGGLDFKITGGIKAGVTEFVIPLDNKRDFDLFKEKKSIDTSSITFHFVETIKEALKVLLVK